MVLILLFIPPGWRMGSEEAVTWYLVNCLTGPSGSNLFAKIIRGKHLQCYDKQSPSERPLKYTLNELIHPLGKMQQ